MRSHSSARSANRIPGYVAVAIGVAGVVAFPLIAQFIDGSADEFSGESFAIWPAIGWVVCAVLGAVVITRHVQIGTSAEMEIGSALALTFDALPMLLLIPWAITVLAAVTGHYLLAVAAAGLCGYHLLLVVPRLMSAPTPAWVPGAPRLQLVVANVFVDNESPAAAARQLIEAGGDVVVLVESTADFMTVFDECGGGTSYPNRIADPDGQSDYAVTIATAKELGPRTEFRELGPLRVAIADIDVDGTSTLIVALNPMATFDAGGHETWKEQIQVLAELVPTLEGPVVIAGDLNSTRYRPEFEQILGLGYSDAIDSLGKGLKPSFKLHARNSLGAVVRLDHALVNQGVHAVAMRNMDARGSDHLPFVVELAVRRAEG